MDNRNSFNNLPENDLLSFKEEKLQPVLFNVLARLVYSRMQIVTM